MAVGCDEGKGMKWGGESGDEFDMEGFYKANQGAPKW